jgi:meiotically up-regulated gene 157 (Mug157) protein
MTWPMSIIAQAMTSDNDDEIKYCLDLLIKSSAKTGFMHEAFNVNNVNDYTRSWFAWANGLFGELVLQLVNERPNLLIKPESIIQAQKLVYPTISEISQKSSII